MDYYKVHQGLINLHPRKRGKTLLSLAEDVLADLTTQDLTVTQMMEGISILCLLSENPSNVATAKVACQIASTLTASINRRVLRTLNLNDESGIEIYSEGDEA
jgi:hypothetical protein